MSTRFFKILTIALSLACLFACVKGRDFDTPSTDCPDGTPNAATELAATATYAEVKDLYKDQTIEIQDDLIIEGYVVSSDEAGNFFSVLYFQDRPTDPTEGFQIEIDSRDSYLYYPPGSKVYIKLKGLYLGKSKDVFKIGGVFTSFGNISVGRLPTTVVDQHILASCDNPSVLVPTVASLPDIPKNLTNTLVRFDNVEVVEDELDLKFAIEREETERTLVDCNDNEITLLNSGYADFQNEPLPEGRGSITGVLLRENDTYRIAVRDLKDFEFDQERCEELIDEFTSTEVFISELADPDNNIAARFVELYNASEAPLSLKGWSLHRYTNANTDISSSVELSDFVIGAESTLVISPNATEFEAVYGFAPDLGIGKNSPADSNGDDNFELVDSFGTVIDVFGVIGEDGTGTDHEFEDGRAIRNLNITNGNPEYDSTEWTVYNDSGDAGTINEPQTAPQDFTPGERN